MRQNVIILLYNAGLGLALCLVEPATTGEFHPIATVLTQVLVISLILFKFTIKIVSAYLDRKLDERPEDAGVTATSD